jgi:hypothetical protein
LRCLATELRLAHDGLPDIRHALKERARGLADTLLEPRLRSFVLLACNVDLDDEAWLEAVANLIAGRPAGGWRDEDAERFIVELRAVGGAFRRYQALHYEALARNSHAGFDAHRITVTAPDGTEYNDVVWVGNEIGPQLRHAAEQALAAAEELLGPRGAEALLAVLAGTVAGARQDEAVNASLTAPKGKARDAR